MKKNIIVALLACVASLSMAKIDISYGVKTEQNKRDYQEDRFVYAALNGGEWFGVYDGHGGDKTSSYLQYNLHNYFTDSVLDYEIEELCCEFPLHHALDEAFFKAEKHALSNFDDGSTAVVAYVDANDVLHYAWVGDSRAVLESDGVVGFATQDHKPDRADEKKRIEDAGGNVYMHGVWRVNGLAVSRSIGDKNCKVGAEGQIVAMPEYAQIQLTEDNHFMIIASDGLWDVMNNDDAVNLVKEQLQTTNDLGAIAQSLIDEAKKRKSGDNITVSVVTFDHHKKGKTSH